MASQLEWLSHDIDQCRSQIEAKSSDWDGLGDLANPSLHNRKLVVAELFFRVLDLAGGVGAVLQHSRYSSSQVLIRALLEGTTTLKWLESQPDPEAQAWLFTAYARLKVESLEGIEPPRPNIGQALEDIPTAAVEKAQRFIDGKNNWCGKPMRQMLEDCDLPVEIYAWTSEEGHGRMMGAHALLESVDESSARASFGSPLEPHMVEMLANAARLLLLDAFTHFWSAEFNEEPVIETQDPRLWRPVDEGVQGDRAEPA